MSNKPGSTSSGSYDHMLPRALLSSTLADSYEMAKTIPGSDLLSNLNAQMRYKNFAIKREDDCAHQHYLENTHARFDTTQDSKERVSESAAMNARAIVQNPQDYATDKESVQLVEKYNNLLQHTETLNTDFKTQLNDRQKILETTIKNIINITNIIKKHAQHLLKKTITPFSSAMIYCDHITHMLKENGKCKAGGIPSSDECTACLTAATLHLAECFTNADITSSALRKLFSEIRSYGMTHLKYQCSLIKMTDMVDTNIREYQAAATQAFEAGKAIGSRARIVARTESIVDKPMTLEESKGLKIPPPRPRR